MTTANGYATMVDQFSSTARHFSAATEQFAKLWHLGSKAWTEQIEMFTWASEHTADLQRLWDLSIGTAEQMLEAASRWAGVVNEISETLSRQANVVTHTAQRHFDVVDGYVS